MRDQTKNCITLWRTYGVTQSKTICNHCRKSGTVGSAHGEWAHKQKTYSLLESWCKLTFYNKVGLWIFLLNWFITFHNLICNIFCKVWWENFILLWRRFCMTIYTSLFSLQKNEKKIQKLEIGTKTIAGPRLFYSAGLAEQGCLGQHLPSASALSRIHWSEGPQPKPKTSTR